MWLHFRVRVSRAIRLLVCDISLLSCWGLSYIWMRIDLPYPLFCWWKTGCFHASHCEHRWKHAGCLYLLHRGSWAEVPREGLLQHVLLLLVALTDLRSVPKVLPVPVHRRLQQLGTLSFPMPTPAFVVHRCFGDSRCDWWEMVSHCSLICLPGNQSCWASPPASWFCVCSESVCLGLPPVIWLHSFAFIDTELHELLYILMIELSGWSFTSLFLPIVRVILLLFWFSSECRNFCFI